jgi:hypothetical protein
MPSIYSLDVAKEVVHYQTISPASLAKSVLDEGGWSNLVVSFPLYSHLQNLSSFKYSSLFYTAKLRPLCLLVGSVQGRDLIRMLTLPLFFLAQRYNPLETHLLLYNMHFFCTHFTKVKKKNLDISDHQY